MATNLQLKVEEFTKFLVDYSGYPYALGSVAMLLSMAVNQTEEQIIERIDVVMKFIRENYTA